MHRSEELKLQIMEALALKPCTMFELSPKVGDAAMKASTLARALDELVEEGLLSVDDRSSTVGRLYKHANETSLSDLRARLLPHRDPVREAHAYEQAQERQPRYRRATAPGADLGEDD